MKLHFLVFTRFGLFAFMLLMAAFLLACEPAAPADDSVSGRETAAPQATSALAPESPDPAPGSAPGSVAATPADGTTAVSEEAAAPPAATPETAPAAPSSAPSGADNTVPQEATAAPEAPAVSVQAAPTAASPEATTAASQDAAGSWTEPGVSPSFTAVSAGTVNCAIKPDQTVYCWGNNGSYVGFPGENQTRFATSPPGRYVSISQYGWFFCGIQTDGSLYCRQQVGEINDPGPFSHVGHGRAGVCALKTNGYLKCWG